MIPRKIIAIALFFIIFTFSNCKTTPKEETENNTPSESFETPVDGYIRLILNDKTGSFSLYYLSDPEIVHYEPLFNSNEPLASFLSVNVDGNIYHLGNNKKFRKRIERFNGDLSLVFESPFVRVTQTFTPYKTSSSDTVNGIMITFKIQNISSERSSIGLRMLLDTNLGEGKKRVPFLTNTQVVSSELLLEGNSNEQFWLSRGSKTSLMGSIVNPVESLGKGPDLIHIANWKRLNDAPWNLKYVKGRSFNNLPNSINDSAVCYFFGPEMIERDKSLTYTVYLTTEDLAWYNIKEIPPHMTDTNPEVTKASATTTAPSASATTTAASTTPAASTATAPTTEPAATASTTTTTAPTTPAASTTTATSATPTVKQADSANNTASSTPLGSLSAYTVESPINILVIEKQAQIEASQKNENANTLILIKLQEILNLFIEGKIYLSEEDLTEIEKAIERHRIRK